MRTNAPAVLIMTLLAGLVSRAPAAPASLQEIYQVEVGLVAAKLKLNAADLDPDVALALAVMGVTWKPAIRGQPLLVGDRNKMALVPAEDRFRVFRSAGADTPERVRLSFAASLALDPPADNAVAWSQAYAVMDAFGDGFDRVLIGILSASDRLPLLWRLTYAAADLLVLRAAPKHIPLYLALARSRDAYLRSRGVAGLGLVGCSESAAAFSPLPQCRAPLRHHPISASQRALFQDVAESLAGDGSYRVRAAAALALGLMAPDEYREKLLRLTRDPAYLSYPGSSPRSRRIVFPVRATACAVLARSGVPVQPSGGEFADRALKAAVRGGRDVSRDYRGMRRDVSSNIRWHDWGW